MFISAFFSGLRDEYSGTSDLWQPLVLLGQKLESLCRNKDIQNVIYTVIKQTRWESFSQDAKLEIFKMQRFGSFSSYLPQPFLL
jgi:hypothetical protein